jgi:NADH-quinone oxidoreductase subunit G
VGANQRPSTWDATFNMVVEQLHRMAPSETAMICSARMTNEEPYMVRALSKQLGITKLDIVPRKGENDGLLVCDDRNPNTNGAKMILGKTGAGLSNIRRGVRNNSIRFMIVLGEDLTEEAGFTAEDLAGLEYLLVIHHSENETTKAADVVLPGVTFAEKYGTMINVAGRIQRLNKAIEPIGDSMSDWEICRNLSERLGCDCVRVIACPTPMSVLDEMAQEFEELQDITWGNIGNEGKVIMDTGVTIPLIEREKAKK